MCVYWNFILEGAEGVCCQVQRCFAVRAGIDPLLDVARQSYSDCTGPPLRAHWHAVPFCCAYKSFVRADDIFALAQSYREEYNLSSLKVVHNARRGYHVSVKLDAAALPPIFIQVDKKGELQMLMPVSHLPESRGQNKD